MADVIVASQRIRGVIRLEVRAERVLRFFVEGVFIRINKVCILFADRPHHLMEGCRMQQIVVVKQPDIVPCRHFKTGVCVPGNAQILFQPPVLDPRVLPHILTADLLHAVMGRVAAVRHAQFPVCVCLVDDRPDHLVQKLLRGVIEGHDDAELDAPRKHRVSLVLQFFVGEKGLIGQGCKFLPVRQLVFYFSPCIAPAVLVQTPKPLAQQAEECHLPQNALQGIEAYAERLCYLPEKRVGDRAVGILDLRQLYLQRLTLADRRLVVLLVVSQLRRQLLTLLGSRMILRLTVCQICFQRLTPLSRLVTMLLIGGQLCQKRICPRLTFRLFTAQRLLHLRYLRCGRSLPLLLFLEPLVLLVGPLGILRRVQRRNILDVPLLVLYRFVPARTFLLPRTLGYPDVPLIILDLPLDVCAAPEQQRMGGQICRTIIDVIHKAVFKESPAPIFPLLYIHVGRLCKIVGSRGEQHLIRKLAEIPDRLPAIFRIQMLQYLYCHDQIVPVRQSGGQRLCQRAYLAKGTDILPYL